MVVSASAMIPPWNEILGFAAHSRWDNTSPPFQLMDVVVSETRSETSEVIFAECHTSPFVQLQWEIL